MINKKILIIANYPIAEPRGGGQKRVSAIVGEYSKVFSSVKFVAVFKGRYPKYNRGDIFVHYNGHWDRRLTPFIGDLISGEAIYKDPRTRKKITKILLSFKPDIIQIEQTFPYIGLKPLLEELGLKPKIILSSHNVEYLTKLEILKSLHEPSKVRQPIIDAIHETEKTLSRDANLTISVSIEDEKAHKKMGAKDCVIAPNGIRKVVPSDKSVERWRQNLKSKEIKNVVTFVGSAYPPNWVGFLNMVGTHLGFLSPDTKLFLAGSIADYFEENIQGTNSDQATFWQRAVPVGRMSDDKLAGLLAVTDVLILPITKGGGSNLKTAEAILSGHKVVATSFAFRSFEKYLKLPNIYIADTPEDFRKAIIKAINTPLVQRTPAQIELSKQVQWSHCLQKAVGAVKDL